MPLGWKTKNRGKLIPVQVLKLLEPLDFLTMYELGNKKTGGIPYSQYFREKGITYDSIDINGLDGALQYDLNTPINLPPRDLVSNIGTSEHVLNQESCFNNIHNLSTKRMVHWVPLERRHPRHGLYGYSVEFFIDLAAANNYLINKLYIETSFKNWLLICCSLSMQGKQPFVWRDEWTLSANTRGGWGCDYGH